MALPTNELSVVSFSTTRWPERERFEAVRSVYARTIVKFDVEPVPDCPLHVEARFEAMPGLGLANVSCSSARARCEPQHLVNDDLIFSVTLAGGRTLYQCGREAEIGPGDAVLMAAGEVSTTTMFDSRYVSFRVPAKAMKPLVRNVGDCIARPIRKDTDALRLLLSYGGLLHDPYALATPELRRLAATHVYELVALALARTDREAAQLAELRGGRAARLRQLQVYIVENLDSDLSVGTVAGRHRLAVRYVQRLFEAEGTTFTEFVQKERLARAHGLLRTPRLADRSIAAVAFDVGFNDPSYFNRAFRRRYGLSPSDVRAEAVRGEAGGLA